MVEWLEEWNEVCTTPCIPYVKQGEGLHHSA